MLIQKEMRAYTTTQTNTQVERQKEIIGDEL